MLLHILAGVDAIITTTRTWVLQLSKQKYHLNTIFGVPAIQTIPSISDLHFLSTDQKDPFNTLDRKSEGF